MRRLLKQSIEDNNELAIFHIISNCLNAKSEKYDEGLLDVFIDSINYLSSIQNANWIKGVWFNIQDSFLLRQLNVTQINDVLKNIILVKTIDSDAEWVLIAIAEHYPLEVVSLFKCRIEFELSHPKEEGSWLSKYEAVPFEFHTLGSYLIRYPEEIIQTIKSWDESDQSVLPYVQWYSERKTKLISKIFPNFEGLELPLINLLKSDDSTIDFTISIINSYEGQNAIFGVIKELIKIIDIKDSDRLDAIEFALQNRGVVRGTYGRSELLKQKRLDLEPWLTDEDARIRAFSGNYILKLDKRITQERHHEEQQLEMWKRQF